MVRIIELCLEHYTLIIDFLIGLLTFGGFVFSQNRKHFGPKPTIVLVGLALIAAFSTWDNFYKYFNAQPASVDTEELTKEIAELNAKIQKMNVTPQQSQAVIDELNARLAKLEQRATALSPVKRNSSGLAAPNPPMSHITSPNPLPAVITPPPAVITPPPNPPKAMEASPPPTNNLATISPPGLGLTPAETGTIHCLVPPYDSNSIRNLSTRAQCRSEAGLIME